MSVSLVDPAPQAPQAPAAASDTSDTAVADLFKRLTLTAPSPTAVIMPPPEKASLDEVLGKAQAKTGGQTGQGQAPGQQAAGKRQPGDAPQSGPANTGAAASSGSLFGQIEPCWRKQPGVSRALVRLELTLSGDGRLTAPPRIIRTSQMVLDERQFFAEARALNALKACLPLRKGATTGVQQVDFLPDASMRR